MTWKNNSSFSQSIPKLQIGWDSTSIGLLKECPKKYYYMMIEGWVPRMESVHLTFGLLYHGALERYDHAKTNGATHHEAQCLALRYCLEETWNRELNRPWTSDDTNKNRFTLVRTVMWYLEQFANDTIETIQLASGKPAVELSFRMEFDFHAPDGQPYVGCGHIDRLGLFQGDVYILDRKTSKHTINMDWFKKFTPDNQFSMYMMATKVVYRVPAKGLIVDAAQVAVNFSKFERQPVVRSTDTLEEWYRHLRRFIRQNEEYVAEDDWPMNDKSCLAGDSIVSITRGKFKGKKIRLDELYLGFNQLTKKKWQQKIPTEILADVGGYVGYVQVAAVTKVGVRKVYRIKVADGRTVKATDDHEFLTDAGWFALRDILPGTAVRMWRSSVEKIVKSQLKEIGRATIGSVPFHPFKFFHETKGVNYGAQRRARLVLEATNNGLTLQEFVAILRKDEAKAKTLNYLPENVEVHHKNGDCSDDRLDNLEVLPMLEHKEHHNMAVNVKATDLLHVVSIEEAGEEVVYDVTVAHPLHNFIANGFVVHNCGNYGGCAFRGICSKSPNVREKWLQGAFVKRTWDPLQSRGDI